MIVCCDLNKIKTTYPKRFHEFFDHFVVINRKGLVVWFVQLWIWSTSWAQVLIDLVRFRLQDPNTSAMKPIRAFFATNVKPESWRNVFEMLEVTSKSMWINLWELRPQASLLISHILLMYSSFANALVEMHLKRGRPNWFAYLLKLNFVRI